MLFNSPNIGLPVDHQLSNSSPRSIQKSTQKNIQKGIPKSIQENIQKHIPKNFQKNLKSPKIQGILRPDSKLNGANEQFINQLRVRKEDSRISELTLQPFDPGGLTEESLDCIDPAHWNLVDLIGAKGNELLN